MKVVDRDRTRWISLAGELNQQESLDLRPRFDEAIESAPGDVVLDLGAITFISTLGIGLILTAYDRLRRRSRRLQLHDVPPFVERVLERMSVQDRFERV